MTLLDDMLALLPDNTSGDIGADDLRTVVTDLYNAAQPIDADLTAIAGLTPTTNNFIQSKSSTWASRTPAQVAADLQGLVAIAESQVTNLVSDLAAKQPLDSDLTTIAALTATTDSVMQAKGSAWAARTLAQLMADLAGLGTTFQPLDSDLTAIAAATATTDSIMQSKASTWTARTLAQVAADLQSLLTVTESQVTNLTSDLAGKQPLDSDLTTIASLVATTDNFMVGASSAWASRTPTQAKTSLALVKGDVGLGNVDNVADASKPVSTAQVSAIQDTVTRASASFSGPTNVNVAVSTVYERLMHYDATISTFSGTTTITLQTTNALAGDERTLRLDYTGSGTVEIHNATAGGTLLGTLPTTTGIYWVLAKYSGTVWSNVQIIPETLISQLAGKQPLDSDLTTIAGLTATTGNFIISVASAWASQTPTQAKTALAITESDVTNLVTDLSNKQPLDSDLTTIAGLVATTDSFLQSKASAWSARTVAQVLVDLAVPGTTFQPLDSDLTTIAGLTATTDSVMQSKGSAWAARTLAQLSTDLLTPLQTAGLAPKASPALTGTVTVVNLTYSGRQLNTPVVLTPGTTVSVDASLGNHFSLTAAQAFTLANPTNLVNDQMLFFAIRQDGTGGRIMTLDTIFRFGTDITTAVLSTAANKTDYLGCRYSSADTKLDVIAFVKGY